MSTRAYKFGALFFALSLMAFGKSEACTNLIVTKGASADGSSMVTYAADSHQLYGELAFRPAGVHAAGSMVDIYEWDTGRLLGSIPEAEKTYRVIGNMNEHQLIIAESTFGGRHEFLDTTAIMDYGSLIYITLQRAGTAREAISIMDNLMQTYGYASEGESFSVADTEECWIMEVMAKAPKFNKKGENINRGSVWVAHRIPDGHICAHANQSRIGKIDFKDKENWLYSKDVVKHAREQGIFSGKDEDFSFCDVYAPLDFGTVRGCDARVWAFYRKHADGMDKYEDYALGYNLENRLPLSVKPNHKLSVSDLAAMMRDHFEGTPMDMTVDAGAGGSHLPYRWRPMEWEFEGRTYLNERAIATQQTGWWFVAQARGSRKDVGGIFWYGVDDAATSPLMPFYTGCTRIPECLREGNGSLLEYSETSMFWTVNRIAQFAYLRYDKIGAEVREVIEHHETHMLSEIAGIDARTAAMPAFERSQYLTDECCAMAENLFESWNKFDKYLLVKYMDGNIKRQNPDGSFMDNGFSKRIPEYPIQEEYSDKWKESVVRDAGGLLLVPED